MDRTRNLSVGLLFSIARKRRKKSVSSSSASKFGWVSFWNLSGIIRESFANLPVDPGAVDFSGNYGWPFAFKEYSYSFSSLFRRERFANKDVHELRMKNLMRLMYFYIPLNTLEVGLVMLANVILTQGSHRNRYQ